MRNLQDVSLEFRSQRFHCYLETDEIPAFGYLTYHVTPAEDFSYIAGSLLVETNVLQNEYFLKGLH